jgi:hypothetical protein
MQRRAHSAGQARPQRAAQRSSGAASAPQRQPRRPRAAEVSKAANAERTAQTQAHGCACAAPKLAHSPRAARRTRNLSGEAHRRVRLRAGGRLLRNLHAAPSSVQVRRRCCGHSAPHLQPGASCCCLRPPTRSAGPELGAPRCPAVGPPASRQIRGLSSSADAVDGGVAACARVAACALPGAPRASARRRPRLLAGAWQPA